MTRFHFDYLDMPKLTEGFIPRRVPQDKLTFDPKTLLPLNKPEPAAQEKPDISRPLLPPEVAVEAVPLEQQKRQHHPGDPLPSKPSPAATKQPKSEDEQTAVAASINAKADEVAQRRDTACETNAEAELEAAEEESASAASAAEANAEEEPDNAVAVHHFTAGGL